MYIGGIVCFALFGLLLLATYSRQKRVTVWQIFFYLLLSSILGAAVTPTVNKSRSRARAIATNQVRSR